MQEDSIDTSEAQRPLSIGKKKGGFLFASAPEKTPEDLRREEDERKRKIEETDLQYATPAAPSGIALATFGNNFAEEEEMATASSLRERLKQYQSLKAEQEMISQRNTSATADQDSFMGPPINKPEEEKEEEAANVVPAPDESWVPKSDEAEEGVTVEEEVEYPDEQFEEEEVIEDEEVEEEEEVTEENDEYEEEEVVGASERNIEMQPSVDFDQDQDVFRALDEAEKAERSFPPPPPPPLSPPKQAVASEQARAEPSIKPTSSVQEREAMPQRDPNECRQNTIILLVVLVGMVAIAALVLPFVYDFNRNDDDTVSSTSSPTMAPAQTPVAPVAPTISPAPTITASPTAEFPTTAPVPTTSPEPTVEPTSMRLNQFIQQFLIPISGEEVFEDQSSPQFRAASYIADEDPFTSQLTTVEQLEDRYAAITFYFAMAGDGWTQCYLGDESCADGQWLVDDVCGWFAVSCDEDGRISGFLFAEPAGNGLSGSLPFEMILLANMADLIIVNNTLTGTLPEAFGTNSTNMRSLLLPGNSFTGSIPNDYLAGSPLEVVILGNNMFAGPVPTGLGSSTSLQILDLSDNDLTGSIPTDIASYEALRELNLSSNRLDGTIPDSLFEITSMERLILNNNPLTGTLSGDVGNLEPLQILNIGESNLEGFLPDELYSLSNLIEFDIGEAGFAGQLSIGFTNLAATLRRLIVDNNSFQGTVPDSFGQMTSLNTLQLHGNGFTGSIAESICALENGGDLEVLTADCSEVTCECCTECF